MVASLVFLALPLVVFVFVALVETVVEAIVLSDTQLDAVGLGDLVALRVFLVRVVFFVVTNSSSLSTEFCWLKMASIFSKAALCFFKLLIDIFGVSVLEASSFRSSSFFVVLADRVRVTVALAGFSISINSSVGSIRDLSLLRVKRTSFSLEPNVEGICCRLALSLATASMLAAEVDDDDDEVELRSLFRRLIVDLPGLESIASSFAFLMLNSLSSMCL